MDHYLFRQLIFVRKATTDYVRGVNEERMKVIPAGLNNNIIWNLGHIYMVAEKFAFQLTGEKTNIPAHFPALFNPGTFPKEWAVETPMAEELLTLLNEQTKRIEVTLSQSIEEPLQAKYKSSTGLQISSVAECLSFCLYHEGMHFGVIKTINQLLQSKES